MPNNPEPLAAPDSLYLRALTEDVEWIEVRKEPDWVDRHDIGSRDSKGCVGSGTKPTTDPNSCDYLIVGVDTLEHLTGEKWARSGLCRTSYEWTA